MDIHDSSELLVQILEYYNQLRVESSKFRVGSPLTKLPFRLFAINAQIRHPDTLNSELLTFLSHHHQIIPVDDFVIITAAEFCFDFAGFAAAYQPRLFTIIVG